MLICQVTSLSPLYIYTGHKIHIIITHNISYLFCRNCCSNIFPAMAPKTLPLLQAIFLLLLLVLSCPHATGQRVNMFNFIQCSEGQDVREPKFKEFRCTDHSGVIDSKSTNKSDEFDNLLDSWESNCYLKVTRILGSLLIIVNLL